MKIAAHLLPGDSIPFFGGKAEVLAVATAPGLRTQVTTLTVRDERDNERTVRYVHTHLLRVW